MKEHKKYVFDNQKNVKRVIYLLVLICTILFLLDFVIERHSVHSWDSLSGFYALYGFIGCVFLVLIAKVLRIFLRRPPNYYDEDGGE